MEDVLTLIPTRDDMIECTRKFDSGLSGHVAIVGQNNRKSIRMPDPIFLISLFISRTIFSAMVRHSIAQIRLTRIALDPLSHKYNLGRITYIWKRLSCLHPFE